MKQFLIIFIKYIFILISLFCLFFSIIFIYNLVPLLKIFNQTNQLINYAKSLLLPVFYHSIFNSLIISIFIYGVLILNYQKKHRLITFFIPVILSSIIIYLIFSNFTLKNEYLNFNKINDARLYFTPKVFSEYNIDKNDPDKTKKTFFDSIEKNKINHAIIIEKSSDLPVNTPDINNIKNISKNKEFDGVSFHKNCNILFNQDKIIVEYQTKNKIEKLEFPSEILKDYNIHNSILNDNYFKNIKIFPEYFISSKNIYINILLWISISFLVLSLIQTIKINNYPFPSLIYTLFFLISFYLLINIYVDAYNKYIKNLISQLFLKEISISLILIIIGIIVQFFRILFIKTHIWEND